MTESDVCFLDLSVWIPQCTDNKVMDFSEILTDRHTTACFQYLRNKILGSQNHGNIQVGKDP